ncbi:NlpC/P60 family protein [Lactiplantibacillus plantarum]|uniref:NlpC/P60 family protein n=1 Tax=Lactiplantibacillus plantarum TaxID=1590 RepID=UPI00203F0E2B|nr:NlpC/P60 family protein [Lactiplantibacillus plantarum]MCM2585124.1 NlpC/P60 family protein [Lactiplantibacillus plantarum]MCM2599049.1 NlpC/P60 family protein [Lactiplantibacillus plantarum]MCM2602211.1 NlpC/P60 family protein [Lactiplantibacillus plantarum]MCM2609550.1 NlpC/P60 family protein [Lactiplantibacillus plantarum]MCM2611365.1 NlpC/P60 family protein [Lactiplantibacillus plantarum]
MAKKVVGREMTSRVGLDSAEAVKSLKTLTAEVKANTSGWKSQETALKSAGEYQKAAAARVDGLAKSMEAQKAKIDELKSRQSGLNRNTKDDEEQYLKLSDQINKASRSYDSMGGQLDRAKSKLQYYNSGLADLQKGYKQSTALSKSYVERLEAEGKSAEANKAKLGGLKQAYSNMEAQYKAQTSELERIKTASGATSDAYKRQQVRVNETATAMAKAKTSQKELVKAMEKEPHGFMHGVRSKLDSVDDKAKKTSHLFGTILGAHLVANGVTNALSSITASFGELTSAVTEYDNKQRTMTATWNTLTGSASKGKQMVNIGNDLASAFNQNINVVDELNQSFYHVFDNAPRTKELTKSILTLGDTLNLSDENVTRLGTNFTHMLSSGKMQLGDFNMINDQLPMYAGKMLEFEKKQQHNSKLTMSTLRDQMSAGKISAKDAEQVMNSLGGKYAKASENLMKTIPGMERSIKTQMPALLDAVYKPIANMKSPLMGQFTKWIGDKDTKAGFKDVGNALALQINDITKAFAGKKFNVGDSLNKMLSNLAKGIDKVGANIVAHKKQIKSFFSSMKTASKTSFNVFVQSLKDIEPILKIIGGFAEKHPKVFAGLASSAYIASKGIAALKLAFSGLDLAKGIGGKLSRLVFKPKVDGAEGKRELTKFASFVKRKGTGMGRWLKTTAKVTTTKAKGVLSSMWKHTKSVGGKIGKGLKWTAKIAYKGASKAFSVLGAGIKTLGKSFLSLGKLLLANPIGLVLTAVIALGVAFYEAYKHIKPFRQWVNKTFKSVVNFGKGLLKWGSKAVKTVERTVNNIRKKFDKFKSGFKKSWNKHWSDMGKSLRNSWNSSVKHTREFFSSVGKKWNGFKNSFRKGWNSHWNAMTRNLHSAWNGSLKHTREFFSSVGKKWNGWKSSFRKSWSKHWNATTSNLHSAWNSSYKHTKNFFGSMGSKWVGWKKSWSHSWNSHWDKMRSNLHSYWNKDLSHTKVFGKSMGGWLSTFKGKFKGGWSSLGTGVENIFKGLWKNLKKFARDGMNNVIDIINDGIKAVDAVIHSFGSKNKRTIPTLDHVKFAEGTGMFSGSRNPITRPTMAMLNDGNDSPQTGNKEMVMLPNGDSGIVQGRNTKMMLPAGTEVLNASETAMLMAMQGVTKYAKGTGFFGDILNSVTSGISGVMSNIGHGLFNGVEKQAKTWWSTLWGGVSDSLDDGTGSSSSLVKAMEKYGAVNKYVWGAAGPSAFDCSGLVEYTLKKMGISFPRTSGEQYKASKHVSNPKPGDLAFFGPGGSEHVGVYIGGGKMYSAENEHDGMGISKVHGGGYGTFAGYGRVPGLSDSTSSDKSSKSSGLLGTIKKQVGSGFWKFISKLADMFGDDGGGSIEGGAITHSMIDDALRMTKVPREYWSKMQSAIIKTADSETGNRNITQTVSDVNSANGNPAGGPLQFTKTTFDAFAFPGHHNFRSSFDQVLAFLNNSDYLNATGNTSIWGHAKYDWLHSGPQGHKRFENGGIINTNQLIEVAEHNKPEMVLPLTNKSRANQLIAQASQLVNGNNSNQIASTNSESNEKLDKVIALLTALVSGQGSVQAVIAKSDVVNAVKSDNKTASQYSQMMGY